MSISSSWVGGIILSMVQICHIPVSGKTEEQIAPTKITSGSRVFKTVIWLFATFLLWILKPIHAISAVYAFSSISYISAAYQFLSFS